MEKYTFTNGEIRFNNQMYDKNNFKKSCVMWGMTDDNGNPLSHIVEIATKEDLQKESDRLAKIQAKFENICNYNNEITEENEKIVNITYK